MAQSRASHLSKAVIKGKMLSISGTMSGRKCCSLPKLDPIDHRVTICPNGQEIKKVMKMEHSEGAVRDVFLVWNTRRPWWFRGLTRGKQTGHRTQPHDKFCRCSLTVDVNNQHGDTIGDRGVQVILQSSYLWWICCLWICSSGELPPVEVFTLHKNTWHSLATCRQHAAPWAWCHRLSWDQRGCQNDPSQQLSLFWAMNLFTAHIEMTSYQAEGMWSRDLDQITAWFQGTHTCRFNCDVWTFVTFPRSDTDWWILVRRPVSKSPLN